MKLLYDFFPIALFVGTFYIVRMVLMNDGVSDTEASHMGALYATAVAIVSSILQVSFFWLKHRRFEKMHLFSMAMIVVLGGLTLILKDLTFIKMKPTAINWLFAIVFAATHFIGDKTLVERMLGSQLELPKAVWSKLNMSWVGFFIASGVLNLYVAMTFSLKFWVNFKFFGLLGFSVIFIIGQAVYLARYMPQTENSSDSNTE